MNFGFWNINNKKNDQLLFDFAWENDLDIIMLGESSYQPSEVLLILNKTNSAYYFAPGIICEKIQFFVKFKPKLFKVVQETKRTSARKLFSLKFGEIIFITTHYNSKVNWSNEDQSAHTPTLKSLIDSVEKRLGHKRTVICGDFNMNPFDVGMVQTTGLHSVMEKKTASRFTRTVDDNTYDFFYNPMWSFLGDLGKGKVSGTMYYSPSKPVSYHWNLFDQVLIRPELIPSFDDNLLDIVTQIGSVDLLNNSGLINTNYSDHLPIKFTLHI